MGPPTNLQPKFAPTEDVEFVILNKGGWHPRAADQSVVAGAILVKELPEAAMFNARIDTVDCTAEFRDAFKTRRCLIPADAYFEWTTSPVNVAGLALPATTLLRKTKRQVLGLGHQTTRR